ncbi:FadR family transcriptional regulator [Actinomyces viscosus]|nr:FadR family transcriptional regulator [Actinomyces viscosus]
MIDGARTMVDTEKSSIVSRAPKPSTTGSSPKKEASITLSAGEAVIPDGAYSTLMTSPATQAETTMNAIKDFILRTGLQVGDALPTESQLCTDLGVSRSSVREAVRTLVALDIVEVRHGHGMFVGKVSMRPMVESLVFKGLLNPGDDHRGLRDIVEVRITLDNALADPVTQAWKNRDDPELDAIADEIEELASKRELFTEQDRRFHMRLLEPLDNHLFLHLTEAFWAVHTLTVPLLDGPRPEDMISSAKAHRAMLQAARAGDVQAYRQAITQHYAPLLAALT